MLSVLLAVTFTAAAGEPHAPAGVRWGVTENHALALAWADLQRVPEQDRAYVRYVWVTNGSREDAQVTAWAANMVSRAATAAAPPVVANGSVTLLRMDLRQYAPREKDLKEYLRLWEEFRFDPRFGLLATRDTLRFARQYGYDVPKPKRKLIDVPEYVDERDGKRYTQKWVDEDAADVTQFVAPHLDKAMVAKLGDATGSQAPVVGHQYYLSRTLTTIKDKGVFRTVYGGLYYDLSGVPATLDAYLEKLGVGNVKAGDDLDKVFDRLRSDARAAVFVSGVTGKPRRMDFYPTLAAGLRQSFVSITIDPVDEDIDIGTHPLMNLIKVEGKAKEVIAVRQNGLHEFSAWNGKNQRQDEVPFNVAHDRTIPRPYTMRLQGAISCIRCHISGNGWQPVTNDVTKLLGGKKLDVFADKGGKGDLVDDLDRLNGLYFAGDPEFKLLPRARDDYAEAILACTGPWKDSKQNQADVVSLATRHLENVYADYHYRPVDAAAALRELGVANVAAAEAVKTLASLTPAKPGAPRDPRIHALTQGLSIPRTDFDLVYSFLAAQAHARGGELAKQGSTP
jgi:hypothetical protein